ncbi:uncharacterized protein LOC129290516 [Prosopis cineraria]|uniref:uncharacterized protein LOC129290516 n=1 Tax=Prosopis cineraria TaxID=364024 RepID=UPI0024108022|nr:uncharacterized protein LOC129290516 [Prosopis cineraria]
MESRPRMTLYDQMSAVDGRRDSLAGSTLEAAMASHKIASEPSRRQFNSSRTLSDIIREDNSNTRDKKSWKIFKDKLWLKRAGSAWFSAIHIPALDISIPNRNNSNSDAPSTSNPPEFLGQILNQARSSPNDAFSGESIHQTSRLDSFRRDGAVTFQDCLDSDDGSECDDWDPAREGTRRLSTILSEERALSAREAEAAAATAASAAAQGEDEPVRMSLTLMDLLEETDRQMGFDASQYRTGYEDDDEEVYQRVKVEKEEDEDEEEEESKQWSIQENCCVCMVRHKGAAFIPCGHTFCRQCSRELWVSRGHCPLCNNVILEILDLF